MPLQPKPEVFVQSSARMKNTHPALSRVILYQQTVNVRNILLSLVLRAIIRYSKWMIEMGP